MPAELTWDELNQQLLSEFPELREPQFADLIGGFKGWNPGTNIEVFAVGDEGALYQRFWDKVAGWHVSEGRSLRELRSSELTTVPERTSLRFDDDSVFIGVG